ncbi:glucose-6-phosphate dehydrogenase assembly protein OpcA [uncultured Tessaracoccus sp.]|uniref:glucose-6-phosphate dehydrogenase assembly protein OpcA n=1 Tax=uncultured Tessaracoccus sp. TaxID=905023 RepID=UPI0025F23DE0|nr:glucose-6-phosphate dehydrogenase assembly protein OpcA [uncultured Tessaracoccus sp.]
MEIELPRCTSRDVVDALTKAHRGAGASGLVLTLVIVTNRDRLEEVLEAARISAHAHPSRVILVSDDPSGEPGIDATIQVGDGLPGDLITLRLTGGLRQHADAVLLPLLLPDSPTVVWWPHEAPDDLAADPIGRLADRRITDAASSPDPQTTLRNRARHHTPGDTDLTWTRLTRWRALLVAAVDQVGSPARAATCVSAPDNAPGTLLAAWLGMKLGVPVEREDGEGIGVLRVTLTTDDGPITLERPGATTATFTAPGEPSRIVALRRRPLTDLLTEELERLDADEVFEATVAHLLDAQEAQA